MKLGKKVVIKGCICEELGIVGEGVVVRKMVKRLNRKKVGESGRVKYVIVYVMVSERIIRVKKEEVEDEERVYGGRRGISFGVWGKKG